ncbi:membrane protein insertase YidC [Helicobacter cappadocius]|uniref:Membrane protein insertase YidC n=1 Tax=Helicobacter cappadocius TaxID=3063998 RepID=A0AA90PJR6_9HELI|nr:MULTISPECIES: membrane protein insertase YidC [unclassified Helicobacter]MDO7253624.1 membrane protein insertase YidC [Helicobacter sp. faydin-H75]MDP2539552.1 membrane protein insertase YidC [Helicobacter sp. faydin-H76]
MKQNNNSNLRIILVVAISFLFIVVYSYFQKPAQVPEKTTQEIATPLTTNPAPSSLQAKNKTPDVANNTQALNTSTFDPNKIIATIKSKEIEINIDSLGRISQFYLKDKKFTAPKQEGLIDHIKRLFGFAKKPQEVITKLPLLGNDLPKPLEMRFSDIATNNQAFEIPYKASLDSIELKNTPETLVLTQNLNNLTIKKIITFYPNLQYDVKIEVSRLIPYVISSGMRPVADADGYAFHGVVLKDAEDKIEKVEDKKADGKSEQYIGAKFIASVDRYYTSLFFTKSPKGFDAIIDSEIGTKNPMPFVAFDGNAEFQGYIGPKNYKELKEIDPNLTDVVEYGIITFFAKPVFLLLNFLHSYTGNWGWAIILLTLIVRIILFPLSYKGMVSMQKLKEVAPKMKELQAKYKDDPQKLQSQMMQLYKKNGANPMGGCLPLILQIPVFFAIYRVLYNAVELKSTGWIFWIHDLSVMDPYFVLPILMGISMYMHQVLTPNTIADPTQAKIFKLLPVVFTVFLITFPAGLVLYWTVNNIFSIIQQLLINRMMEKKKALEIAEHKHSHNEDGKIQKEKTK